MVNLDPDARDEPRLSKYKEGTLPLLTPYQYYVLMVHLIKCILPLTMIDLVSQRSTQYISPRKSTY